MKKHPILTTTFCVCLQSCSSQYVWQKPDGSPASAVDISECHQEARRGELNRQLAAPVEIAADGSIQPIQHNTQNSFITSQIYQQCLSDKGYQQVEAGAAQ